MWMLWVGTAMGIMIRGIGGNCGIGLPATVLMGAEHHLIQIQLDIPMFNLRLRMPFRDRTGTFIHRFLLQPLHEHLGNSFIFYVLYQLQLVLHWAIGGLTWWWRQSFVNLSFSIVIRYILTRSMNGEVFYGLKRASLWVLHVWSLFACTASSNTVSYFIVRLQYLTVIRINV